MAYNAPSALPSGYIATDGQTVITVVSRNSVGTTPAIGVAADGAVRVGIGASENLAEAKPKGSTSVENRPVGRSMGSACSVAFRSAKGHAFAERKPTIYYCSWQCQ